MFPLIYGQDAGKFIHGSSTVLSTLSNYSHSEVALGMINFLKIGNMAYPAGVLVNKNLIENESKMSWTLTDNTKISSNVHCLEFSSNN